MFAFLFVKEMDPFYQIIGTYPTSIFTVLLGVSIFYWLVVVLGFFSIDILDVDIPDAETDVTQMNVMAGVLLKFGLNGIPLTIVITLISIFGWLLSFYGVAFLTNSISNTFVNFLAETGLFFVSLYISVLITALLIKPLRKIFSSEQNNSVKKILGQVLVVRSSRVDDGFGEATYEDGGAGLILKVRSTENKIYVKGDRVVPFEYVPGENIYSVVSDTEFLGKN
jgi:hypothetical protein